MKQESWDSLSMPIGRFDRVVVLDETPSTQGDARVLSDGRPGLVVIGKKQVAGRGRQGRTWDDGGGASLSTSLCVDATLPAAGMSLAVGLGVLEACEGLGATGLGLKWPNDVVERSDGIHGRKVAGVLIESSRPISVVGVGVNVYEREQGWSDGLENSAVSLEELGVKAGRPEVAAAMLESVSKWLDAPPAAIGDRWLGVGTLRHKRCVFRVDGRLVAGTVVDLDRQWRLVLQTDGGERVRIDAAHAHLEEPRAVGS
ncbi:MAG: biotin--[acetyl-CoA-carboxylase] ligase [Phycisphaerales bacterium]|jgi:BirA family biotin operon repressor/biotin-[acetyl-CoA-carboxylase] ligase